MSATNETALVAAQMIGYDGQEMADPPVWLDDEIELAESSGSNVGLVDRGVDARVRESLAAMA